MEITVLIPLYNGIEFLKHTLESVIKQTYKSWTLIIGVNGHGPEGGDCMKTVNQILQQLGDSRIRAINLPNAKTISDADNALLDLATTEWVAHTDADDLWHPQKLELQIQTLQQLQLRGISVDLLGTATKYFGEMNHQVPIPSGLLSETNFIKHNPIIHSSILVKRDKIRYPPFEESGAVQDYAVYLEMIGRGSWLYNIEHILTYHRVHKKSFFNQSGKQNPQEVSSRFFKPDNSAGMATIVTAFYDMPSKYPKEKYLVWLRHFFESCPGPMVIFLEEKYLSEISDMRKKFMNQTMLVVLPREEWMANKKFGHKVWEYQLTKDPEGHIHSPDLYKIWYEKKEFVKKVIEANPFHTKKFIWCDAGVVRDEEVKSWVAGFGREDRIPEDKLLLLQIDPFTEDDIILQADGIPGNFLKKNRIGGTIQAGTALTWKQWSDRYDQMLSKYLVAGRFIGKDQSIMANCILEAPSEVLCIYPPKGRYRHPIQIWFFLVLWLSANEKRFKLLLEGF
jgi:glycosyltransferase involved in cell wall biosynthesis